MPKALIVDVFNERTNKTMRIQGHTYENLSHRVDDFNAIASAIVTSSIIRFTYKDKPREVNPYKLNNTNGIWYLVGAEGDMLKNSQIPSRLYTDLPYLKSNSNHI